jgi:hypothetical protein
MRSLVLVVALVLVVVPAAAAKEITKAEVCGPDGCTAVADVAVAPILGNGGPPRTPPTAAPYYDVRLTMAEGDQNATWSFAAVPARHAMRADDGTWMQMAPDASALVTKTAAGRKPYPASEMVGWAAAPDPKPEPAGTASPLRGAKPGSLLPSGGWPEGVMVALIALGAAFVARAVWLRGAARRA